MINEDSFAWAAAQSLLNHVNHGLDKFNLDVSKYYKMLQPGGN